jgi:hypothetical protein
VKVLLLTDSVSLPRRHSKGEVLWEEIYFCKLQQRFPGIEFVLVGMGGATITQLQLALNYYTLVKPDLVILQSGIVDCAPRALGQLEQQLIIKLKMFRLVRPFTTFLRKHRNIAYTSPRLFEETLLKIKNIFSGKPLVGIGILPGSKEYDAKVPGVSRRIDAYNKIIQKHTIYIDNSNFPPEGIINDFHHMSSTGHEVIFKKLEPLIENFYNNKTV